MAFPQRIQDKIDLYTERLNNRYIYYKLSDGYETSEEAARDTTPTTTVYSDSIPSRGIIIYSDIAKTNRYDGGYLWYHVFDSSGRSLSLVVQISDRGLIR
jgi:hypothetical protein